MEAVHTTLIADLSLWCDPKGQACPTFPKTKVTGAATQNGFGGDKHNLRLMTFLSPDASVTDTPWPRAVFPPLCLCSRLSSAGKAKGCL